MVQIHMKKNGQVTMYLRMSATFRTKENRKLDLISAEKEINKATTKIAVKVIDIFGNDTMKIVEFNI